MKPFCVIGPKASPQYDRTWFTDSGEAVDHGIRLARKAYAQSKGEPVILYVVEIKEVIEVGIPAVRVRKPSEGDVL